MGTETEQPKPPARSEGTGQAAAAQKNREREARKRVIGKLERLGFPQEDWPAFVREPLGPEYEQTLRPDPFQPPDFERLRESYRDWAKKADVAWPLYREAQIERFKSWVKVGVDQPIPEAKSPRGAGKKRRNAEPDARYEWTARRLQGEPWKVIAIDAGIAEDRVRKAVHEVLRTAGWPVQRTQTSPHRK